MKTAEANGRISKREGVELLIGYPVDHLLEYAARIGIRPIIVRRERTGSHRADAISRVASGRSPGPFAVQHGPGTEKASGRIAQAFAGSVPVLALPMGYPRRLARVHPDYDASLQMQGITQSAEPLTSAAQIPAVSRSPFQRLRAGRGGAALLAFIASEEERNSSFKADRTRVGVPPRPRRSGPRSRCSRLRRACPWRSPGSRRRHRRAGRPSCPG